LASLSSDIERLSRLAYSEYTKEVRDKIACTQFIAALPDSFIKFYKANSSIERSCFFKDGSRQSHGNTVIVSFEEMKKEIIFVKREGVINSLIKIAKVFLMLKLIKIKLERNLVDFKKGKSFYLKGSAGNAANKDISDRNVL